MSVADVTIASPEQLIKMLRRNVPGDYEMLAPEIRLQFEVIGQAIRDAEGATRDKEALEARDEARQFFVTRRSDLHADLCGLNPDFLVETVLKHTAWGQQLGRGK